MNKTTIITSGIHGDEKSGIISSKILNKFSNLIPKENSIKIFPCLNQTGIEISSRENYNGDDLNRNFNINSNKKEIVNYFSKIKNLNNVCCNINLHEDDLSNGFYLFCYENKRNLILANNLINYLKSYNIKIANHHLIDTKYQIKNGIVSVNSPPYKGIQDFYFHQKYFNCPSFSLEIPKNLPMKERLKINILSILYLIKNIQFSTIFLE